MPLHISRMIWQGRSVETGRQEAGVNGFREDYSEIMVSYGSFYGIGICISHASYWYFYFINGLQKKSTFPVQHPVKYSRHHTSII